MPKDDIAPERIRELLDYDPVTGILTWRYRHDLKPKASSWNERNAGKSLTTTDRKGYIYFGIYKSRYAAHRVAWAHYYGAWPKDNLDHINGIKTDNRIANLREATVAQNGWNVGLTKRNTSGHRGVRWHKEAGKWQSGIHVLGRHVYLGLYDELEDAVKVRKEAEAKYYGEFAYGAKKNG